jgi:hypothetical protein
MIRLYSLYTYYNLPLVVVWLCTLTLLIASGFAQVGKYSPDPSVALVNYTGFYVSLT